MTYLNSSYKSLGQTDKMATSSLEEEHPAHSLGANCAGEFRGASRVLLPRWTLPFFLIFTTILSM